MIKMLRFLLCLEKTVIEGARIRENGIVVAVRPHKREMYRCPKYGRRCPKYGRSGSPRSWRALDLGNVMCWLEFAMERVECPEHGVLACKGHGKAQLNAFFDLLTEEQRAAVEVVTADGATWIADVVEERCPNAERVMDPFHVVSWATSALDELRKQAWRDARKDKTPEGRAAAKGVKGSKYSLLKNPEDLTERQAASLESVARSDKRLYRGYLLKEGLRVFGKTFFDALACRKSTLWHRSQLTLLPDAGR